MQVFRNQSFQNQTFVLEDSYFENCALRDCDLFYSGGDFEWVNATFESCRFHWRGPAKNMYALLQFFNLLREQAPPVNVQHASTKGVN